MVYGSVGIKHTSSVCVKKDRDTYIEIHICYNSIGMVPHTSTHVLHCKVEIVCVWACTLFKRHSLAVVSCVNFTHTHPSYTHTSPYGANTETKSPKTVKCDSLLCFSGACKPFQQCLHALLPLHMSPIDNHLN